MQKSIWQSYGKIYTDYLKLERGLSANTCANYALDLQKFSAFFENSPDVSVKDINDDDIRSYLYHLSDYVSPATQSRTVSALRSFFDFLLLEKYTDKNPVEFIELPKQMRKIPDVLSTEEIDSMIACIDLSKEEGTRNKAIIETLYGCGLRVSELISLRISDLFFEENFIRVVGKGNKERFVPIADLTIKYIEIYLNHSRNQLNIQKGFEDIVFLNRRGKQLTRAMIFTITKQLAEKAEIIKNVSPHVFRHSFATHLLENGANLYAIQMMLGHESIITTEVYMHVNRKKLREVLEDFHPWANQ